MIALPLLKQYSLDQLNNISKNFYHEILDSANGKITALPFIKQRMPFRTISAGVTAQVISIGGSLFKTALIKPSNNKLFVLSNNKTKALPRLESYAVLAKLIKEELFPGITYLAINFAYPLKPITRQGWLDGKLISGSKEHQLDDLIDQPIAKLLEIDFQKNLGRKIRVTIANDTICLLLSGLSKAPSLQLIAGVIGTGLNFAFFLDRETIVNLESANFNRFSPTPTGELVDKHSQSPGQSIFEKEVAGAYLYQHFNLITNQHIQSTEELSKIAGDNAPPLTNIARQIIERSASLAACQMAALSRFKEQQGVVNSKFIMEGNLFWEGWEYLNFIKHYCRALKQPLADDQIVYIANSNLTGAAYLLTTAND